jgi:hypothetical protein
MGEQVEMLVQRFLDAELDRGERQALLRLLGSRSDVRQRLLEDEAILDAAAALPRAQVSRDFVAKTLAKLPAQDAPGLRPARTRLQLRWVSMAAAASLLLAAGFLVGRQYTRAAIPPAAPVASAEPTATVLVRLVMVDPQAMSVAVAGDFNGWDPLRAPLERRAGGVWTTTLPLEAGRYQYMFFVDGKEWLADPLAAETSLDGFGAQNSVLDVEL